MDRWPHGKRGGKVEIKEIVETERKTDSSMDSGNDTVQAKKKREVHHGIYLGRQLDLLNTQK